MSSRVPAHDRRANGAPADQDRPPRPRMSNAQGSFTSSNRHERPDSRQAQPQSDGRFESTSHKRTASGNPRPSSRTHEDRRIEERRTERTFVTQLERLTQRTRSPQRAERSSTTSAKAKAPETHKTSESQQKEARVEPPGMLRILRSDRVPPD
ncbi:hypothetical protein VDGD_08990 [Verticillium dahliae]|nr:hypothetical protein VDGD_08990 [Verticillium dahliae]